MADLYPEGAHKVCVETCAVTVAGTGNPQFEVRFYVDENTRRTAFLSLTDAARASFVDDTLEKLGFNGDFEKPEINEEFYKDYNLDAYCKHEANDKGVVREKWMVGGGKQNTPADNDLLKKLNASWRAKHKPASAKPGGAPKSPPKAPPPAGKKAGPPPAEPEEQSEPFGKEQAWEAISEALEAKGKEIDVETWHGVIKSIGKESEFGEEEWRRVVAEYPPF